MIFIPLWKKEKRFQFFKPKPWFGFKKHPTIKTCRFYVMQFFLDALPFGGLWKLDADTWALRHCECKSTIAVDAEHDELSVLGLHGSQG
jgi:hypothetical protein